MTAAPEIRWPTVTQIEEWKESHYANMQRQGNSLSGSEMLRAYDIWLRDEMLRLNPWMKGKE